MLLMCDLKLKKFAFVLREQSPQDQGSSRSIPRTDFNADSDSQPFVSCVPPLTLWKSHSPIKVKAKLLLFQELYFYNCVKCQYRINN
jgi:hypothetical protein